MNTQDLYDASRVLYGQMDQVHAAYNNKRPTKVADRVRTWIAAQPIDAQDVLHYILKSWGTSYIGAYAKTLDSTINFDIAAAPTGNMLLETITKTLNECSAGNTVDQTVLKAREVLAEKFKPILCS